MPQMHWGFAPLQPPNTNPLSQRRLRRLTEGILFRRGEYAAGYRNEGVEEEKGLRSRGDLRPPVPGPHSPGQTDQVAGWRDASRCLGNLADPGTRASVGSVWCFPVPKGYGTVNGDNSIGIVTLERTRLSRPPSPRPSPEGRGSKTTLTLLSPGVPGEGKERQTSDRR